MRIHKAGLIQVAAAALALCALSSCSGERLTDYPIRPELDVMIPMRDGVRLATDLYFPSGASGKLPTVFLRTVYTKSREFGQDPIFAELVRRGYVVVIQDTRGRGASEGSFIPTVGDRNDAYDTVSWLTSQTWSNQRIGTAGCSSPGEAQLLLAISRHPRHVTAIPQAAASAYNVRGRPWASFDGGVFELAQTAGWFSGDPRKLDYTTLPIIDILKRAGISGTEYEHFASSNPDGEYFRNLEWIRPGEVLDMPMLFFDSWYDYGAAETLELFNNLRSSAPSAVARENQFIVLAPTTHCGYASATENTIVGARDLGDARFDQLSLRLRWYDHWLKDVDNGVTEIPPVQYYLMGKNQWKSAKTWPVPGTHFENLYLVSSGHANSRLGDGILTFEPTENAPSDAFRYDPGNPVPSLGGHACCTGTDTESGAYDQSKIEQRDDVLVYTSAVLTKGLEVTGPLEVVLHVSSSAPDTDFTAKLVDVYPDGRAFNIEEGALRLRYREGFEKSLRMRPDEIYRIRLDLHVTSNYFGSGHRIRLEVSSSNFPRWDRNLNSGGSNYDETEYRVSENVVHHSGDHRSYIRLPIVH
jgi:predicted acyl esterase